MTKLQNLSRLCSSLQSKLLNKKASLVHLSEWRSISTSNSYRVENNDNSSQSGTDDATNITEGSTNSVSVKEQSFITEQDVDYPLKSSEKTNASSSSVTEDQSSDSFSRKLEEEKILQKACDTGSPSALKTMKVVPGKGQPPEPPITCCGTGCANCVWIVYAEELRDYYKDGGEQAKQALEKIDDPSLKAFIKLELGLR
ncbi:hypothetical protein EGW08_003279 [Elysia chlorotica]|uniref:Oxidoreductase-like domain-containing protein n=1 Tax=Elysia chlorotica TaxID=188477 RepID=A0A433U578_ELYCH|nr:hypothetical protein EGW08_003279 [Elysia chlorotica]